MDLPSVKNFRHFFIDESRLILFLREGEPRPAESGQQGEGAEEECLGGFCLFSCRLRHGHVRPFALLLLLLFGCSPKLAGATLVDKGGCFHGVGCFTRGHTGVFTNVNGEVCVERLQLSGKELIGQRVEAIRAPVESGPFQKIANGKKSQKVDRGDHSIEMR
ncbi:hypothetical protein EYF80_007486 [Liparis tanakae]|uniref:Uncharacterized protein n=1 Tax=Liparis tanakae TaxID=230148 RepID=A0A4Z2IWM9_9TELE|nr:hypothetical protein EYF80_007486 [Liparis tanakae]